MPLWVYVGRFRSAAHRLWNWLPDRMTVHTWAVTLSSLAAVGIAAYSLIYAISSGRQQTKATNAVIAALRQVVSAAKETTESMQAVNGSLQTAAKTTNEAAAAMNAATRQLEKAAETIKEQRTLLSEQVQIARAKEQREQAALRAKPKLQVSIAGVGLLERKPIALKLPREKASKITFTTINVGNAPLLDPFYLFIVWPKTVVVTGANANLQDDPTVTKVQTQAPTAIQPGLDQGQNFILNVEVPKELDTYSVDVAVKGSNAPAFGPFHVTVHILN